MKCLAKSRALAPRAAVLAVAAIVFWLPIPDLPAQELPALAGKPVVGISADGQLELFQVSAAGELRHRWQKKANGDWSAWSSLGEGVFPGIATGKAADERLMVFAVDRTNYELKCLCQSATNDTDWSASLNLGGNILPPLSVVQNTDGRLEVFAVAATNGSAWHIWQTGSNGIWSAWSGLGGAVQPGLLAARNRDGRIEVFGLGADHGLVHCWQRNANTTTNWSGWSNLRGGILPGFAAGMNALGVLEIFGVNRTNSTAVRICQTFPGDSGHWTPWQEFEASSDTNRPATSRASAEAWRGPVRKLSPALSVGKSGDGRLEVFAVAAGSGDLLHRWETLVNGADRWSPWASLGLVAQPNLAVGANEDGDLEVFAVDRQHPELIHHRRQISSASDWLDWSSLDHRTRQYRERTWQSDEGLPDNMVQAITQTTDGFLWVGTRAGLARFDGNQFLVYDGRSTPTLKGASITTLCAGREGALWIGTDGGGVVRLKGGMFTEFSMSNGLAGDAVRVIFERRDGSVWIGTTTGLSCWRNGQFSNYYLRDGLLSELVRNIYEDHAGDLWIATGKGLNRLRRDGSMDAFAMPSGLPNDSVRAICQDQGGRIWIGSNNGLLWYNWFWGNTFYAYNTKYGLSDTFVSAICEDATGNLWVGTYSGLNRFHEGRFYNQPDSDGQPYDKVNILFVDREGDIWVGSNEGLSRLTQQDFFTYTKQQGLTHNNIMSVLEDPAGRMWIGTWGGGLDEMQEDQVRAYASANGLSQDLILSLCVGRDGSLWAGADFDGGLLHLKDGHVTRYLWQDGLINAGLRVLREDRAGNLWIGTDRGLNCFKEGQVITNGVTEGLARASVRDLCESREGGLWIATQKGLARWRSGELKYFTSADGLSDNSLNTLLENGDGSLWIGTSSGGLVRYRKGVFSAYTQAQGLFSDEILGIAEDGAGWLWMSCTKGIFRVRESDLDAFDHREIPSIPSLVYGKNDGMRSPQCNGRGKPSAWKAHDGRLWFPTSQGLVTVDPKTVSSDDQPPAVFIETVRADAVTIEDGRTNLAGNALVLASRSTPLRVPAGYGAVEFQYAALGFARPEKQYFQYRLEGADAGWVDAGTRRVAYYNNLAPRSYRFRVRARNQDGVWNQTGAVLDLVVLPHYWQTLWFSGSLALAIIGGAGGLALYATRRRLQRKLAALEQQQAVEKERGRIARDMHDQIGAGLTQIGLLGEFTRREAGKNGKAQLHAEKICGLARELAQTVDEIVWTVNPQNDTLTKLGAYLAAYGEDFFQGTAIRCRLEIPPGLPAYPLSAELRHNLFLTVKEALNNIVKHSQATEAHLELSAGATGLELRIQDNGVGFVSKTTKFRNGLANMRARVAELGGQIQIDSRPQNGTRICLRIPLKITSPANG